MVETEADLTEIDWLPRLSVCPLTEQQSAIDQVLLASSSSLTSKPPYRLNSFLKFHKKRLDCNAHLNYSYGALIKMAIGSTPEMQMTLSEIYRWVSNNFDYYRYSASSSWKVYLHGMI